MTSLIGLMPEIAVIREMMMATNGQTLGQQRVRAAFNPSADSTVDKIKALSADLIDLCETIKTKDPRCAALAQTHYEDAAMWAVKCATTGA